MAGDIAQQHIEIAVGTARTDHQVAAEGFGTALEHRQPLILGVADIDRAAEQLLGNLVLALAPLVVAQQFTMQGAEPLFSPS
jgi:hypothetical protein